MISLNPGLLTLLLFFTLSTRLISSNPLFPSLLPAPLLPSSPNLNLPSPECVNSPIWTTKNFIAGDCYTAIATFVDEDAQSYGGMMLEFLAKGIRPGIGFAQTTPRRYQFKSCTMAIVMMKDIPPGLVHVPQSVSYSSSDLASYASISATVDIILRKCLSIVSPYHNDSTVAATAKRGGSEERSDAITDNENRLGFANPGGYDTVGAHNAVGVFLWDTGSLINIRVGQGLPMND